MTQAIVNQELRQGDTLCNLAAPDIFSFRDEDGHAYVTLDVLTPGQVERARAAQLGCPKRAITIED